VRHRLVLSLSTIAIVAIATLLYLGQGQGATAAGRAEPSVAAMPACADARVIFRLFTDSPVYLPGQSVRVSFEVRNAGSSWCTVAGQCDEVAPISIFDGSRMLWSDKPCYNHEWDAVRIPLAPGRLITYRGKWRTQGAHGGWYEARAAFLKTSVLIL
jgi:hypothetical protein